MFKKDQFSVIVDICSLSSPKNTCLYPLFEPRSTSLKKQTPICEKGVEDGKGRQSGSDYRNTQDTPVPVFMRKGIASTLVHLCWDTL